MAKFKRYDSYKNSGVEWLGEIPSHWEISKLKFIGKIFAGLSDKKGDDFSKEFTNDKKPFIPFTNVCNNLKIDKNQMQYVKINPYETQNKVREKDIVFLMSSETLEDIGKCSIYLEKEQLYLNSFCKGFRPNLFRVNAEFLNYLLQSKTYRNYFNLAGRGFTRINIKQEYIANLLAVLPPKIEQEKIASYLDEKIAKIDTAISEKEKLIELLKEQKQIIINDAVTKGLNKNAKFKNSGVKWLGEIPSHWEISKLKFIGKIFAGLSDKKGDDFSKEFTNDKKPFIPFTNVCNNLKIDKNQMQYVKINPYETQNKVREKDIVFLMSSETLEDIGKCSIYLEKEQLYLNSFCKGFRPNLFRVNAEFLNYLLQSKTYRNYFNLAGRGFTRINIKQEYIANLLAVLPPKIEQEKIASYLDEKISKIDKLLNLEQECIKSLKEYKASLIDSIVTGKVRII